MGNESSGGRNSFFALKKKRSFLQGGEECFSALNKKMSFLLWGPQEFCSVFIF
jgi:hypothetical protein